MAAPTYGPLIRVEGLQDVLQKLGKSKTALGKNVANGLKKAGLFLLAESQDIVPVQLGNLQASGFCRNVGDNGWKADIVVGYTAKYAVYVHEILTNAHGRAFNIKYSVTIRRHIAAGTSTKANGWFWRKDREQAKFLEKPCRTKRRELLNIIRTEASK